jgi:hypothetical protein
MTSPSGPRFSVGTSRRLSERRKSALPGYDWMTARVAEASSMLQLISGSLAPLQQLLIHQGNARPSGGAGHGVEVEHAVPL